MKTVQGLSRLDKLEGLRMPKGLSSQIESSPLRADPNFINRLYAMIS